MGISRSAKDTIAVHTGSVFMATFAPIHVNDLRSGAAALIGRSGYFEALWVIDDGPYSGQWAFRFPPGWITQAVWAPEEDLQFTR